MPAARLTVSFASIPNKHSPFLNRMAVLSISLAGGDIVAVVQTSACAVSFYHAETHLCSRDSLCAVLDACWKDVFRALVKESGRSCEALA